jgi:hypothetical protein
MSQETRWPHKPWFSWAAIVLSSVALCFLIKLQERFMTPVEQEDLPAYIRVSLLDIPFRHTYTVIETSSGTVASAAATGVLYRKAKRWDRARLKMVLQSYVYQRPLCRVLQWPLLGFLVVMVLLGRLGHNLDNRNNGDRLIQGAPIVSHWRWNWPTMFRKSPRDFYIETK